MKGEVPMKVVKLTRAYHRNFREGRFNSACLYNVGEVAGFSEAEADHLIATGGAVEVKANEAAKEPNDDDL
jgi:hypothetical protein